MGTPEITKALVEFQKAMPKVAKTKTNPAFHSKYADLADVTDAAMPLLTRQGLAFSVAPRLAATGGYEVAGMLLHTSGESLEAALPLAVGLNPQQIGSAITYARRYLFGCLTGIVTDDDEDGNASSRPRSSARTRETPPAPVEDAWTTPPPDAGQRPSGGGAHVPDVQLSAGQQRLLHALLSGSGIKGDDEHHKAVAGLLGRPVVSMADLTLDEFNRAKAHFGGSK